MSDRLLILAIKVASVAILVNATCLVIALWDNAWPG